MATAKFYQATNMTNYVWFSGLSNDAYDYQNNDMRYTQGGAGTGTQTALYHGSFDYEIFTQDTTPDPTDFIVGLTGGTLQGYDYFMNGLLRATLTNMNFDALEALIYMEQSSVDATVAAEFMELLMVGNDSITGSSYSDTLAGYDGNDTINAGRRADIVLGGNGLDILNGGIGNDVIEGGNGVDTLTGGAGSDAFVFNSLKELGDTITDFSSYAEGANDVLRFKGAGFGGLEAGGLDASMFQSSTSATANTADVRFFFERDTGILRYDADGSGLGSAAVVIANFGAGATVTVSDIVIV